MAKQPRRPSRPVHRRNLAPAAKGARRTPQKKAAPVVFDTPVPEVEEPRTFRLGIVEGATPGKWIDAWKERMPRVPLELVPITISQQRTAFDAVDAAIVRMPLTDDAVHIITLYDELPVVVASTDSHLLAADELTIADLAGEVVIGLTDDALAALELPETTPAKFAPLSTADAVATAASAIGIVVVPMSLARLHHRKDVEYRVLTDGPTSTVALAWPRDRTTPDIDTFVGIVRGRTANSSR